MSGFFARVGSGLELFNGRMSLLFGVVNSHLQLRILFFDRLRRLRGCFVCPISGLQLPINRNMKRFDERRRCALWRRDPCLIIGGYRPLCSSRPA